MQCLWFVLMAAQCWWFELMAALPGITSAYTRTNASLSHIPRTLDPIITELILDRNRITAITNELEDYSYLQVSRSLISIMKPLNCNWYCCNGRLCTGIWVWTQPKTEGVVQQRLFLLVVPMLRTPVPLGQVESEAGNVVKVLRGKHGSNVNSVICFKSVCRCQTDHIFKVTYMCVISITVFIYLQI